MATPSGIQVVKLGLSAIALASFSFWLPAAQAEQLSIVAGTSAPFAASQEGAGFFEVLDREMFRRIGIDIEFSVTPSERALINVNSGIDDAVSVRIAGMERTYPNLVPIPEKVMDFDFVAFTLDPKIRIGGFADLKPYAVAFVTGWKIYERSVKDYADLTRAHGIDELFALLKSGRAQVVLTERWQGLSAARRAGVAALVVEPPFARLEVFTYLNKRYAALAPRAAQALAQMKADGTYARIFDATLRKLEKP